MNFTFRRKRISGLLAVADAGAQVRQEDSATGHELLHGLARRGFQGHAGTEDQESDPACLALLQLLLRNVTELDARVADLVSISVLETGAHRRQRNASLDGIKRKPDNGYATSDKDREQCNFAHLPHVC